MATGITSENLISVEPTMNGWNVEYFDNGKICTRQLSKTNSDDVSFINQIWGVA